MRKFLLLIALIISVAGLNAQNVGDVTTIDYESYSLHFTVTSIEPAECILTSYDGSPTDIIIPATITFGETEFAVTSIGSSAFFGCSSLTSIEIPSGFTSIGDGAFSDCSNLTTVFFGENSQLTSIGNSAFYDCNLQSIEIPSGVTSIGNYAFSSCYNLQSIEIPSGVTSIGDEAFSHCSSLTSIEIPSGVTSIGSSAFIVCGNLISIEIPSSVTSIGSEAFSYCSYLTTVSFGENSQLTSIGNSAFYDCGNLQSIEIPSSVTSIGDGAFSCYNLKSVRCLAEDVPSVGGDVFRDVPSDMQIQVPEISIDAYKAAEPWSNYTITKIYPYHYGESVVEEYEGYSLRFTVTSIEPAECEVICSNTPTTPTSIVIPATVEINGAELDVTSIGSNAFYYCDNLQSIEIQSGVTSIGEWAFYYCSYLTTVSFGDESQLTSIGNHAFYECSSLTSIEIPSGVTSIGEMAFYECSSLTSIEIPSGVTSIGDDAFSYCSNLERIQFEDESQLTSIGNFAFSYCSSLTSIEIPSGVTSIGNDAFSHCNNILKLGFEENSQLTSIGNSAFYYCSSLTSIEIPSGVTSIGDGAFFYCDNILKLSFEENSQLASIGNSAFYYCSSLTSVSFDENSQLTSIGNNAFSYCSSLTSVSFGENSQLTSIGNEAFRSAFTYNTPETIEIPSSVESIGNSAFEDAGVTNVLFGENSQLTSISNSAFKNCYNLDSIVLPKNVREIRNFAFQGCGQLKFVGFEDGSQLTSISDLVFKNCNQLQKVEIPSMVNYIGYESFANCGNLIMIENAAVEVPQTDSDAFNACPERMRIQVPAESLEDYQTETPWNNFTLVSEIIQHEIALSTNLEYAGYTEGAGTYFDGENVTIDAVAYEDWYNNYTFAYWSENGEFVSSEANYTFVAESDRNLVANFMNDNYWNPNSGMSSHNMIVTADVQLEGVSTNNINIEIGAFCSDELRGNARIQYFEAVDKFLYQIVIYGENNDQITFKLYDHNTQQVMEYNSHDYLVFTEDATYGSIDEPWEINFNQKPKIEIEVECNVEEDCNVTGGGEYYQGELVTITAHQVEGLLFQNWTLYGEVVSTDYRYTFTVEEPQRYVANYVYAHDRHLNKGWNWYSTYMQLSGEDGLNTVQSALGSAASQIKSQTAFDTYELGVWIGGLDDYSTEKMYMINVIEYYGYDLTIIGTPVIPSDYTIELVPNWNWIGYSINTNMSINDALSGVTPQHGDYVKSQTDFSQYYEGSGWLGALQTLEKGKGYMYQNTSNNTIELVYPNEVPRSEVKANYSNENNHWIAEIGKYPTNMNIIAVVNDAGADFEIGAFCNGECRGSARPIYIEQLDRYMIFLTVYGEGEETISFKYYDVVSEEVLSITNELKYSVNSVIGTIDDPYVMSFATVEIDEKNADIIGIYPNPVNTNSEIHLETECDNVEIYNALGVKIAEYENVSTIEGIETSGIYVIKIIEQGNVKFSRLVVK